MAHVIKAGISHRGGVSDITEILLELLARLDTGRDRRRRGARGLVEGERGPFDGRQRRVHDVLHLGGRMAEGLEFVSGVVDAFEALEALGQR